MKSPLSRAFHAASYKISTADIRIKDSMEYFPRIVKKQFLGRLRPLTRVMRSATIYMYLVLR